MYTPKKELYLIDFGIARRYNPEKARDTGALGSPGYAAPEQYGQAHTSPRTDIYGLGATLQALLTGKEPMDLNASSKPEKFLKRVPHKLQPLLQKMMAYDPEQRPESAEAVKKALQHFYDHELIDQKLKRHLSPIWQLTKHSSTWITGGLLLLGWGILLTPFLLPFLLLSLAIIIGHSLLEYRIEVAWSTTLLSRRKTLEIIYTSIPQTLPAIFLVALYCYVTHISFESIWFSGYILLFIAFSAACCSYFIYALCRLLYTLLRIRQKQRKVSLPPVSHMHHHTL